MRCSLLLLTLALAAPAAADADVQVVSSAPNLAAGPALTANGVAWVETTSHGRLQVREAADGQAPRTISTPGGRGPLAVTGLDASPTRTVFGYGNTYVPGTPSGFVRYQEAFAGPPTGPLKLVAGDPHGTQLVSGFDLSGDALLTVEETGQQSALFVRDLATGAAPVAVGSEKAVQAQIAGDDVAYSDSGDINQPDAVIHVVNWRTGTELYRTNVPVTPPLSYDLAFDLQADGTLAIVQAAPTSTPDTPVEDLAVASAAHPAPQVIAKDVDRDVVQVADGRIVFAKTVGESRQLLVSDLAGRAAPASFPVDGLSGVAFDGKHLAFATSRCVYRADTTTPAPVDPPSGACPQMVVYSPSVATSELATARAKVTCDMSPRSGCTVVTRLKTTARKPRVLAKVSATVALGTSKVLTLKVPAATLRSVRKRLPNTRKRISVDISTVATDAAGHTVTDGRDALLRIR